MANYNKVILMGRLTRDPQLSYLPSKTPVVEFSLATSRKYKKQDGSMTEDVCFTDCQMFGKRAEVINKYLKKGDPLFVEGRLKFDSWQDKEGKKRSKLRVFVESFEFMGGGQKSGGGGQPSSSGGQDGPPVAPPGDMGFGPDDDIPF
jgi:single-strand DNA-binding protein